MAHKLENPKRLEELNPKKTLEKIGMLQHDTFCDIGAGTGIFTYVAASMTEGKVYGVEISEAMQNILHEKNDTKNVIKKETPIGPPVTHRISEQETAGLLTENGLEQINQFRLGDNFYCLVFKKKEEE